MKKSWFLQRAMAARAVFDQPHWLARREQWLHQDLHWCLYFNQQSLRRPVAIFFKAISRLGDGGFWVAMAVATAALIGPKRWPCLMVLALGSQVGTGLYRFLKKTTVRPRPYQVHQAIALGERPLDHFSFPSGHTLHAVMFTLLLGSLAPALLWAMVPFAMLVALSRMVLGLHYPSDVLAGAVLGGLVAQGVLWAAHGLGLM